MVVIPYTMKMTSPKWRTSKRSFAIGVSEDKGRLEVHQWGSGSGSPQEDLADLPEALKLPERQKASAKRYTEIRRILKDRKIRPLE